MQLSTLWFTNCISEDGNKFRRPVVSTLTFEPLDLRPYFCMFIVRDCDAFWQNTDD